MGVGDGRGAELPFDLVVGGNAGLGEEAAEVVMAAKDSRYANLDSEKQAKLVGEVADLWFHCFVALSQFNLRPEDVIAELNRRAGISGIAEKAARK